MIKKLWKKAIESGKQVPFGGLLAMLLGAACLAAISAASLAPAGSFGGMQGVGGPALKLPANYFASGETAEDSVKIIWTGEKEFYLRKPDPSNGRMQVTFTTDPEGNLLLRKWSGHYAKHWWLCFYEWSFEPDTLYGTVKFTIPGPGEPKVQWPRIER